MTTQTSWLAAGGMGLQAFFLFMAYAIARPGTESLFLADWGSERLPIAWIAVAIAVVGTVAVYQRYAVGRRLDRLYGAIVLVSVVLMGAILGLRLVWAAPATFLLYVWKDVHIVVLCEVFWTGANASFSLKRARWVYGLFCVMGSLGGMSGNLLVGPAAESWGTATVLWGVAPLLALSWAMAAGLGPKVGPATAKATTTLAEGWRTLRQSAYLGRLMVLIAVVQVAITLVDFSFNQAVEAAYPETDARTAVVGQVYFWIDAASLALQALTGPILAAIGVRGAMLGIPMLLGAALMGFLVHPAMGSMAVAKVASKAMDYSLFRAAKEMLYIPLPYEEKTQGKAFIDMASYRVAKGAASLLVLGLVAMAAGGWVAGVALALVLLWIWLVLGVVQRWRALTRSSS